MRRRIIAPLLALNLVLAFAAFAPHADEPRLFRTVSNWVADAIFKNECQGEEPEAICCIRCAFGLTDDCQDDDDCNL